MKHLTDKALLQDTKYWSLQEKKCLAKLLEHLHEIDLRKLYSDLGYSSLYDYLIVELKYSRSAAFRRLEAARLIKTVPEVIQSVSTGELNLMQLCEAQSLFKSEGINLTEHKINILEEIKNKGTEDTKKTLNSYKKNPKTSEKITIEIDEETKQMMRELMGLMGHEKKNLSHIFKEMVREKLRNKKKEKFALTDKSRLLKDNIPSRKPSASQKRAIYQQANGKCQNCGGHMRLQVDHIKPYSLGGKTEINNLRLLCFSCNQRARLRAGLKSGIFHQWNCALNYSKLL